MNKKLTWIEALKKWNEDKGTWCIPRKDTPEYFEVKNIVISGKKDVKKKDVKKKDVKKKDVKKKDVKKKDVKKKIQKTSVKFDECFKVIDDALTLIYSYRGSKDYKTILANLKTKKVFFNTITMNDFYPTPLKYSKVIYDFAQVDKDENLKIFDICAGLGSLSTYFLKNIDDIQSLTMIELNETLFNYLKCFEKSNKVNVINKDFFNIDELNISHNDNVVIVSNPPFSAVINGQVEKLAWQFFMIKINKLMKGSRYKQRAFIIVPESPFIEIKSYKIGKPEKGDTVEIKTPNAVKKRMKKIGFNENDIEDIDSYLYYYETIDGFKGLTKNGKPRNLNIKCYVLCYGFS